MRRFLNQKNEIEIPQANSNAYCQKEEVSSSKNYYHYSFITFFYERNEFLQYEIIWSFLLDIITYIHNVMFIKVFC